MEKEFSSLNRRLDALTEGGASGSGGSVIPPPKVRDDAQCDSLVERLKEDGFRKKMVSSIHNVR